MSADADITKFESKYALEYNKGKRKCQGRWIVIYNKMCYTCTSMIWAQRS